MIEERSHGQSLHQLSFFFDPVSVVGSVDERIAELGRSALGAC